MIDILRSLSMSCLVISGGPSICVVTYRPSLGDLTHEFAKVSDKYDWERTS